MRSVDQQQVADGLVAFITSHLQPSSSSVVLQHEEKLFLAGEKKMVEPHQHFLPDEVRVMALPGATARPDIETDGFPAPWRTEDYVLAQAIEAEGHRFGHMTLGEKRTRRSYVGEDLDLRGCRRQGNGHLHSPHESSAGLRR